MFCFSRFNCLDMQFLKFYFNYVLGLVREFAQILGNLLTSSIDKGYNPWAPVMFEWIDF